MTEAEADAYLAAARSYMTHTPITVERSHFRAFDAIDPAGGDCVLMFFQAEIGPPGPKPPRILQVGSAVAELRKGKLRWRVASTRSGQPDWRRQCDTLAEACAWLDERRRLVV